MPLRPGTAGYFASTSGSWRWPPAPPQHSKHLTGLCDSSMEISVSAAFIPPMLCGHDEIELVGFSGGNRSTKRKKYEPWSSAPRPRSIIWGTCGSLRLQLQTIGCVQERTGDAFRCAFRKPAYLLLQGQQAALNDCVASARASPGRGVREPADVRPLHSLV